jgi:hypothetical protein
MRASNLRSSPTGSRSRRLERAAAGWIAAIAAGLLAAGAAAGCALGLNPSLIDGDGGAVDAAAAPDALSAGDARAAREASDGISCTVDDDCAAAAPAGSCVGSSFCDPVWHVCMFDVCDAGACQVASCDPMTRKCSAPTSYGFAVSVFHVAGGVGGWGPAYAVAAAYPFLFVLTTNGVTAYNVANPMSAVPPVVVHGAPFIPTALVASGRRIYLVGPVEGAGPTFREAIAWIDVPGDPFLVSLAATTAWIGTTEAQLASVVWNGSTGLALTYAATAAPTSTLAAAPDDSITLVPSPIAALMSGASIVAASGGELVAYRYGPTSHHPFFSLVSGVSQSSGKATAEQNVNAYGQVDDQATFATSADSTVLWSSAPLRIDDGGATGVASTRLTWLLPSDAGTEAGFFSTSLHADLESYPESTSGPVVGPVAFVDTDTAVGLAASSQDITSTSIQVFSRSANAIRSGQRAVIPSAPNQLGVASSQGFVYVLVQDDSTNQRSTVWIVAPGCTGLPPPPPPPDAGASSEGGTIPEAGLSTDGGIKRTQGGFVELN